MRSRLPIGHPSLLRCAHGAATVKIATRKPAFFDPCRVGIENLAVFRNTALWSCIVSFVYEAIMRRFLMIVAIATAPAWIGMHADPAAAQNFDDRWSIIPKAHAEPAPEPPGRATQDPQTQRPAGQETKRGSEDRSASRSFNHAFSGKASFYSYSAGKTASGSSFDRNLPTAAHRSLPFGTRVRVTDLATSKSVVVRITDRGPKIHDRVLDLSLGAARSLGITDRGVVKVRAEIL
jgi:rare lipoprotein A